jgi:general secretion pathway protein A
VYEAFFQFKEPPFNLTPDARFVYLSRGHQEALEHLIYGVEQRKGFILMAGDIGAGKTTLTRLLLDRLDENTRPALIFNTYLTEIELLRAINREFGVSTRGRTREELIAALSHFLIDRLAEGGNAVLIIDEAQNLSVPVLEQLRMLSNLETDTQKLIQIILAGQPELTRILNRRDLAQLNQRVTVRCHLLPMEREDTIRYIQHRLYVAGPQNLARFSSKTCRLVHRLSLGLPRRINALCDRALLVSYAWGVHEVAVEAVRQAHREITGEPVRKGRWFGFRSRRRWGLIEAGFLALVALLLSFLSYVAFRSSL